MDSYNFQNIKAEKAKAILRYRRLQKITALFRVLEFCVFLIIASRFTTQLPLAFRFSGEYFRGLSVSLLSPRFVFVVGNAIVIILFLKSGQKSGKDGDFIESKIDFYDDYVQKCEKNRTVYSEDAKKQPERQNVDAGTEKADDNKLVPEGKRIHRSQSENLKTLHCEERPRRELRRSATEKCQKTVNSGEKPVATSYAEDEMSSEEFRRTVEAFIARQQKLLREEEFSPMICIKS